jgi:multicomponent Na+:H+ antiporter subunit A
MQMSMVAAVLSGFLLALAAPGVVRLARGASGWLLALLPAALTVYFVRYLGPVAAGRAVAVSYPWAPDLGVSLSFYLDGLSLLFALLICGIGALVVGLRRPLPARASSPGPLLCLPAGVYGLHAGAGPGR